MKIIPIIIDLLEVAGIALLIVVAAASASVFVVELQNLLQ